MDWITTTQGIITLIASAFGLLGTAFGIVTKVVAVIKARKNATWQQNLAYLRGLADAARSAAEATGNKGADKKTLVLETLKAAAKQAGIDDFASFADSLSKYIDDAIAFYNKMKDTKKDS